LRRFYCNSRIFLITLALLIFGRAEGQHNIEEAALKSVWLAHFSKFIEWPNIDDTTEHFVIKVLGNNTFNGYLEKIYNERQIKGKKVKIEYIEEPSQIGHCHILFISRNKKKYLEEIRTILEDKPILTIGDTEGYAKDGVMINFFIDNNRVGFEVNISTTKKMDLDVSFRLLELAKIVKDEEG